MKNTSYKVGASANDKGKHGDSGVALHFSAIDPAVADLLEFPPVLREIERQLARRGTRVSSGPKPFASVSVRDDDLRVHCSIHGDSGQGKTRLVIQLVAAQLMAGHSVVLMDPHWRTVRAMLAAAERSGMKPEQIRVIDPNAKRAPGWNPLLLGESSFHAAQAFAEIFARDVPDNAVRIIANYRHALIFAAAHGLSPVEANRVLDDDAYRRTLLQAKPPAMDGETAEAYSEAAAFLQKFGEKKPADQIAEAGFVLNRTSYFTLSRYLRDLIGARENTIDFESLWKRQGMVLIHLDRTSPSGEKAIRFLAGILCNHLAAAAMHAKGKVPVLLVVDEMGGQDTFIGAAMADILRMARQTGLRLMVATQVLGDYNDSLRTAMKTVRVRFHFRMDYAMAKSLREDLNADSWKPPTVPRYDLKPGRNETIFLEYLLTTPTGTAISSSLPVPPRNSMVEIPGKGRRNAASYARYIASLLPEVRLITRSGNWYLTARLSCPVVVPAEKRGKPTRQETDWARVIQNLPERHAVFHVKGRPPAVIRVSDYPDRLMNPKAAFADAVMAAGVPKAPPPCERTAYPDNGTGGKEGGDDDGSIE